MPIEVSVAQDDTHQGDLLAARHADLGWAPPVVCARLELAGGRVVLRAERDGGSHYRAALVSRVDAVVDLTRPGTLTAAWVDQDSAGGYLLARSFFAARKINIESSFRGTVFLGTYERCVAAVLEGRADVTSVFATLSGIEPARSALDELATPVGTEPRSEGRAPLRVLAFTGETFNDGIVIGPSIEDGRGTEIADVLEQACGTEVGRRMLSDVFRAERFVSTGESVMRRTRAQPSA